MNWKMIVFLCAVCAILISSWIYLFPQGQKEAEKSLVVQDKKVIQDDKEYSNDERAEKILRCSEGNWTVDNKTYEVSDYGFAEKYGTRGCFINGKWYDTDYLRERERQIKDTFRVREKIERENGARSFGDIIYSQKKVCLNTTISMKVLEKIDVSSYDKVELNVEKQTANLIKCKNERTKTKNVYEDEVEKIENLVSGGV
jgi:hypothetical protein